MRIYISGPITGYEDLNKSAFDTAERALERLGHEPVNPHKLSHDHARAYGDFLREDLTALLTCDAIFMLPGWEKSRGAKFEFETALIVDMGVFFDFRGME